METIQLIEYTSAFFPRHFIPEDVGEALWHNYHPQITVEFPSPKTAGRWKLTSQGWVGHIPLTPEFHIALHPKVPLLNLLGMLEYAYHLKSFCWLSGLINCHSLEEFYNHLALVLAKQILERCRQGIYRTYMPKKNQLAYIRGRLNLEKTIQKPWTIKPSCDYQEYTGDIEDNQILAWTLRCIIYSRICQERILPVVRETYHTLQGCVTLQQFQPADCLGRQYNRLNEDYRPLHALCRFFLENTAPSHQLGNRTMLPFLVNMGRLYELFVAEWLKAHLPPGLFLKYQEQINIGNTVQFQTDLVLYEFGDGTPRYILDTKYKVPTVPDTGDITQVVAYGLSKGCREAVLVYPAGLTQNLDEWIGNIHIRSLTFSLDGDLNQAGEVFLQSLLGT